MKNKKRKIHLDHFRWNWNYESSKYYLKIWEGWMLMKMCSIIVKEPLELKD